MHSHSCFLLALRARAAGEFIEPTAFGLRGYLARSARRLPPSHLRVIYEPSTNHLRRVKGFLTPSLDFARDKFFASTSPLIKASFFFLDQP